MTEQKKRGRPRKNPVAEAPKRRGRPAGTRAKHVPTVESVRKEWEVRYAGLLSDHDLILKNVEENGRQLMQKITNLEHALKVKEVRELKLFGIIEYLEDKVKNAIKSNSI